MATNKLNTSMPSASDQSKHIFRGHDKEREHDHANTNVYGVYDCVAKAYTHQFFADANGVAIRSFVQSASGQEHKDDYSLHLLGTMNKITGAIKGQPKIVLGSPTELGAEPTETEQQLKSRLFMEWSAKYIQPDGKMSPQLLGAIRMAHSNEGEVS